MEQKSITMLTHDQQIDRRILAQYRTLTAAGWTIQIIAMPSPANRPEDQQYPIHRIIPQKHSLLFKLYQKLKRRLGVNSTIFRRLKTLAISTHWDPEKLFINLYWPQAKQYPATVIMAHDLPMLPIAHRLAKACQGTLVYDCHEFYPFQEFSKKEVQIWETIERKYIHDCSAVITVNPSLANQIKKHYQLPQVHVIENAVEQAPIKNTEKFFHQQFNLTDSDKVMLFQGNLTENRHLHVLVDATDYLTDPNIHIVIMGDGPLKDQLVKQSRRLKRQGHIHFHPAVPQETLIHYTAAADAGIIPYQATCLNTRFCSPNKLYEFIAAGLPIIATTLPELQRIIEKDNIGVVGNNHNAQLFAKLIESIIPTLETKKHNVSLVKQQYGWQNQEKELNGIFNQFH